MKTLLGEGRREWFEPIYGQLSKSGQLPKHWLDYNVLNMVQTIPEKQLSRVKFYIDCGDDDFLYEGNSALHVTMRDKNVSHEYRIRDGVHNWTYWRNNVIHRLKFVDEVFHR